MSFWKTLAKLGLPIVGAVGGDLLGPELGLSTGLGGAIGGALGGAGAGFLTGESLGGTAINALLGGAGGFGLGELLGPGAGFGAGGAFGGPAMAAGGLPAGTSAAAIAGAGGHADAIGGAGADVAAAGADSGGGIMDFLKRNPWIMPAGAVGMAALQGNQPIAGEKQLKALAAQTGDVSKMMHALQTGELPPGAKAMLDNATNDAIAGIRSKYASMGLSGSTMEAQDVAAAQQRAAAQTFQLASAVTTQGLDAAGLSAQLYEAIAQMQLGQDSELSNALASLSQSGGYFGGLKSVA